MRILAILSGLLLLGLLITARMLAPNEAGYGTHQQLGLPPCTSVGLFGVRCPACGMTTSWALATRGAWGAAAEANVGGLMLAIIAMACVPISCYFFLKGRASRGERFSLGLAVSLVIALLAATIQWAERMMHGP